MNSLGVIACAIGLRDSLNPTIFMTCAVFIVLGFCLASSSLSIFWIRVIFVLVYALSYLNFTFGPGQVLILHKEFFFAAKIIYFGLSTGAFIFGIVFLKDWALLSRGLTSQNPPSLPKGFPVHLATVILAVILSALAAIGPMNNYIMLLGNESILKGQWQSAMPILLGYTIFGMWPIWFMWALLSIKNLRPTLLKIICAAVFFTASSCVILAIR